MLDRIREAMAEVEDIRDAIEMHATLGVLDDFDLSDEQADLAILGLGIAFSTLDDTMQHMERSE